MWRSPRRENGSFNLLDSLPIDASFLYARGDFKLGERLGSGGFATVNRVTTLRGTKEDGLAAKRLPSRLPPADAKLLHNEISIWLALEHTNILRVGGLLCVGRPLSHAVLTAFWSDPSRARVDR